MTANRYGLAVFCFIRNFTEVTYKTKKPPPEDNHLSFGVFRQDLIGLSHKGDVIIQINLTFNRK
jgi:hypothetical protein